MDKPLFLPINEETPHPAALGISGCGFLACICGGKPNCLQHKTAALQQAVCGECMMPILVVHSVCL
ncbi:hypothetical protein [Planococcus salinus]|uniref:hypothetical protein n=1 Tax=Planococcus salinus TaxID=1848460 RepID=UPI0011CE221C|nr:hypothetical protein [Planococcus salinus]